MNGAAVLAAVPGGAETGAAAIDERQLLQNALLESRYRWRHFVALGADLAFETDAEGRLVFLAPDPVLGWPADTLLGERADLLLPEATHPGAFNPFMPGAPIRRHRAWVNRADGRLVCLSFTATPLHGPDGALLGARGVAQDLSEYDRSEAEVAAALRRGEAVSHILSRMLKEVLAPRMMHVALEELALATGSSGVAVVDLLGLGEGPRVLHQFGAEADDAVTAALSGMADGALTCLVIPDGRSLLAVPAQTRFGEDVALLLWRGRQGRGWDADDRELVAATVAIVRLILEHEAIQREMARLSRTDPLTGLLNRRAFFEDLDRRIARLEVDGLPGTLIFIDLDHFKILNDARGHDAGDEALRRVADLLRRRTRPFDLVAQLGGDEFAMWFDGADEFAAAERAELLRGDIPAALRALTGDELPPLTASIGIVSRWPGGIPDIDSMVQQADQAMYAVKRAGRGQWKIARPEAAP
jgi:diguanylate cyclase (GGDEF)-like protein